jgi:polysaccharide biosynthesis transport protein
MSTPLSGTEPTLSDYLRELRRSWRIVMVATTALVAVTLGLSFAQDKVYTASTDVAIMKVPARISLMSETARDMDTELALARGGLVRDLVERRLGFAPRATVQRIRETSVVRITTENGTPDRAVKAAASYAAAFIEVRRSQDVEPLDRTRNELQAKLDAIMAAGGPGGVRAPSPAQAEQLAALAEGIRNAVLGQEHGDLRSALAALDRAVGADDPDASNRIIRAAALQLLIDEIDASGTLARNNAPEVVSPAVASSSPIRPTPLRNGVVAAALGLMASAGLVLLCSYLDRRVHDASTLNAVTGLPVLGVLAPAGGPSGPERHGGRLEIEELRSALQLRGAGETVRAMQLTSPRRVDALPELAVRLGAAFARADLSVIVLDADFRSPAAGAAEGLSSGSTDPEALLAAAPLMDGVTFIPAGGAPVDPAGLLSSRRFANLVAGLLAHADVVLVIAPPVLEAPDPLLVGRVVDATLLVAGRRTSRVADTTGAVERLHDVGLDVMGAVLASVPRHGPSATSRRSDSSKRRAFSATANGHSPHSTRLGADADPPVRRHG